MAMAMVASVDNSGMTSYRKLGGASLTTGDIAGARSRPRTMTRNGLYPQWNEPQNKPRRLHPPHTHTSGNRPVMNLTNIDIEGSQSASQYLSDRHVDPIDPQYTLPSHQHRPFTPPAAAPRSRCLDLRDIDGTAPTHLFPYEQRDSLGAADIEGANTQWCSLPSRYASHYAGRAAPRNFDVLDINTDVEGLNDGKFRGTAELSRPPRSPQLRNPLSPTYRHDVHNAAMWPSAAQQASGLQLYGPISGTRTRPAREQRNGPDFSLNVKDVPGASARKDVSQQGPMPKGRQRQHYRDTNRIDDIRGTAPMANKEFSSRVLEYSHVSRRDTHPLNPDYMARRPQLHERHPILARSTSRSTPESVQSGQAASQRRRSSGSTGLMTAADITRAAARHSHSTRGGGAGSTAVAPAAAPAAVKQKVAASLQRPSTADSARRVATRGGGETASPGGAQAQARRSKADSYSYPLALGAGSRTGTGGNYGSTTFGVMAHAESDFGRLTPGGHLRAAPRRGWA